ncbi:RNA methyltransferase [SAR86 cluster bacterium]|jgi:23S rRNA (guanosine2251-2'-O)-methyltransferase|nr:RNA methyltransferase [SAR86 cluster bacterium]
MLKERIVTTTDINFIKTLIELNHEKIVEIIYKEGIKRITSIIELAKAKGVHVSKSDTKDLKISMTFYPQEIKNINFLEDLIFNKKNLFFLILDRIQDPQNLGSIFRTSLGMNVDAIIVPNKNSCRLTNSVREVSKGATEVIPLIMVSSLTKVAKFLIQNDVNVFTCSSESKKNFYEANFKQNLALVFGSENDGVSKALEELASEKIKIPMDARLESLNVSNASSVILFEVFRQREL